MDNGQTSIEKIPKLIIVVLVIVVTILFIWKADIYGKIINFFPDLPANNNSGNQPVLPAVEPLGKEISAEDIYRIILATQNSAVESRKCLCKNKCSVIANAVLDASKENKIDNPLLVLSMIMQESSCNPDAISKSSVGLMQITQGTFNDVCKKKSPGLFKDFNDIKGSSDKSIILNIKCGTMILRHYYEIYGKKGVFFKGCFNKDIRYYNWQAAVRAYNGLGCPKTSNNDIKHETDNYVDSVILRLEKLENLMNIL